MKEMAMKVVMVVVLCIAYAAVYLLVDFIGRAIGLPYDVYINIYYVVAISLIPVLIKLFVGKGV